MPDPDQYKKGSAPRRPSKSLALVVPTKDNQTYRLSPVHMARITPTFLAFAFALAQLLPSVSASSRFIMNHCSCDDQSLTETYNVNFIQQDGSEAGVTASTFCYGKNDPRKCTGYALSNNCGNTGFCGIGEVCYDVEVFHSDQFSINGKTYNKNDYPNSLSNIYGSAVCKAQCNNIGANPSAFNDGSSFAITITGFTEPQAC